MTYSDVLIQVLAKLTGEPEKTVAEFIIWWKEREPNKVLDKELTPQEADTERAALIAGADGPMVKMFRENFESFRLARRAK